MMSSLITALGLRWLSVKEFRRDWIAAAMIESATDDCQGRSSRHFRLRIADCVERPMVSNPPGFNFYPKIHSVRADRLGTSYLNGCIRSSTIDICLLRLR